MAVTIPSDADVERAVKGIKRHIPQCCMFEVPPGCDEQPDVVTRVAALLRERGGSQSVAVVSADAVRDELELIDLLTRSWSSNGDELALWRARQVTDGLSAPQLLKSFFVEVGRNLHGPRVALFRRFDRVFRIMTGGLLAAMRDLEQERLLITVTSSPVTYEELYRARAAEEASFTSDYGQMHMRITVRPFNRDEALGVWRDTHGLPADDKRALAHFEVALRLSGGLPGVFTKACLSAAEVTPFPADLRLFRDRLAAQLTPFFERLVTFDERLRCGSITDAIARVHLGVAGTAERQVLAQHRWREYLMEPGDGSAGLKSPLIGLAALRVLRRAPTASGLTPELLYSWGDYRGCLAMLQEQGVHESALLWLAAELMDVVFGESNGSLYFGPDVKWRRAAQLADSCARGCREDAATSEFERWRDIALALASKGKSPEDAVTPLALRAAAVMRDENPVTAAYSGLPLIEDALRHYVELVARLPPTGRAFGTVSAEAVERWWPIPGRPFRIPDASEELAGVSLTMLVATLSGERGSAVFDGADEVSVLMTVLEQERNALGHNVRVPRAEVGKRFAEHAFRILDRILEDSGSATRTGDIVAAAAPPRRFLTGA